MDKTELFMVITFCTIIFGTLLLVEKGIMDWNIVLYIGIGLIVSGFGCFYFLK